MPTLAGGSMSWSEAVHNGSTGRVTALTPRRRRLAALTAAVMAMVAATMAWSARDTEDRGVAVSTDPGSVFITDAAMDRILKIRTADLVVIDELDVGVGSGTFALAETPDTLYVRATAADGRAELRAHATARLHAEPASVAIAAQSLVRVGGGAVWVVTRTSRGVEVVSYRGSDLDLAARPDPLADIADRIDAVADADGGLTLLLTHSTRPSTLVVLDRDGSEQDREELPADASLAGDRGGAAVFVASTSELRRVRDGALGEGRDVEQPATDPGGGIASRPSGGDIVDVTERPHLVVLPPEGGGPPTLVVDDTTATPIEVKGSPAATRFGLVDVDVGARRIRRYTPALQTIDGIDDADWATLTEEPGTIAAHDTDAGTVVNPEHSGFAWWVTPDGRARRISKPRPFAGAPATSTPTTTPPPDSDRVVARPRPRVIDAEGDTTCAIRSDGDLACWGRVGDRIVPTPTVIEGFSGVTDVSVSDSGVCAVARGEPWCWNNYGGDDQSSGPARVNAVVGLTQIDSGFDRTCGVREDGSVSCWGTSFGVEANPPAPWGPATVDGLADVVQLASDSNTNGMCALDRRGNVWCWSFGEGGRVQGDSWFESGVSSAPTRIPLPDAAISLAAEADARCAIAESGVAMCWGSNGYGQASPDDPAGYLTNPAITTIDDRLTDVARGEQHTCALASDRTVWCWGANGSSQLGHDGPGPGARRVDGLDEVIAVAGGRVHTCAVASGQIRCWGANSAGQLGRGHPRAVIQRPTRAPRLDGATSLVVLPGIVCGVWPTKGHRCWGSAGGGQFGDGASGRWIDPRGVPALDGISGIDSASFPSENGLCGIRGQAVECWGAPTPFDTLSRPAPVAGIPDAEQVNLDWQGQGCAVSRGTATCWEAVSSPPFVVEGISDAQQIAGATTGSCVLRRTGDVSCWDQPLSWDRLDHHESFEPFTSRHPIRHLWESHRGICATGADRVLWCWEPWDPETGPTTDHEARPIDGVPDVADVASSGSMTCARTIDAEVRCWGTEWDGVRTTTWGPRRMAGLTDIDQLVGTSTHMCARSGTRSWCWGDPEAFDPDPGLGRPMPVVGS